jgi:3-deoxy-D-manno-octulosonic-acid transferase
MAVANAVEAVAAARRLLADEPARKAMSVAGLAFCAAHRGASERTAAICERLLTTPPPK